MSSDEARRRPAPDFALSGLKKQELATPPSDLDARYELLGALGSGAMGAVHRARDRATGELVAVKRLESHLALSREALERFRREAESLSRLSHPNIVKLHALVETPPAIVMELVSGPPLALLLERGGQDRRALVSLVAKVARGVQHAHEHGIVHRDLKPANILVTGELEPKIADFGIARLVEAGSALTKTGTLLGTPTYMSPEQASGDPRAVAAPTDIYSLGVILYEVLTGSPPHEGAVFELLDKVRAEPPRPPREIDPTIPVILEHAVLRALEKDPARRQPSAGAFADEIERSFRPAAPPARSRRRALALVPVIGLLALLFVWNRPPPPASEVRHVPSSDPAHLLRGIDAGELGALAASPGGAAILDRLAAEATVLPLDAVRDAMKSATPRAAEALAILEAIAVVTTGSTPEERAQVSKRRGRGRAAFVLDAAAAVARVGVSAERVLSHPEDIMQDRARFKGDELAPLDRLADRPELLLAVVAPLGTVARASIVAFANGRPQTLLGLVARTRALEAVASRLPPGLLAARIAGTEDYETVARLAASVEALDPLIAGYLHSTAFAGGYKLAADERQAQGDAAERLLGGLLRAEGALTEDETTFARRTLANVSRWRTVSLVSMAYERTGDARRAALVRATEAARVAVERANWNSEWNEPAEAGHRLAALLVADGRFEEARLVPGLAPEDPLATFRPPLDPRTVVERTATLIESYVPARPGAVVRMARALRAKARRALGDLAGAQDDESKAAGVGMDGWIDGLAAERFFAER